MPATTAHASPAMSVIRWILVLPAAILGAVLIAFPVHWIVFATFVWGDEGIVQLSEEAAGNVERVLTAFAMPLALILCGARMAPSRRLSVAVILALLLVTLSAASFWYVLQRPDLTFTTPVRGAFGIVASLIGIVTSIVLVKSWHRAVSDSDAV